jgi:hypothetical protein
MKKTVHVARTAFDLIHVNRLRVSSFRIEKLCVTASGKSSRTYWPAWSPKPKAAGGGSDDFHFVPEKETARIEYEIDDPFALVGEGTLELFCRFEKRPMWTLRLRNIGEDTWTHGLHSLKWDGRVFSPAAQAGTRNGTSMDHDLTAFAPDEGMVGDFPDGYATLEHTPYKLKLTVVDRDDDRQVAVAWTYFQILVKGFEFEWGPDETIPGAGLFSGDRHKNDRDVFTALKAGAIPTPAAPALKIFLPSNLFKYSRWFIGGETPESDPGKFFNALKMYTVGSAEMSDETGYTVYRDLWDDGPRIPVLAKIRLSASDNSVVKLETDPGAKCVGNAKFLWDWVDDGKLGPQGQAAPAAFLTDAIEYYHNGTDPRSPSKDHNYPQGRNCHVDRGGKRGPDAPPVFPEQGGYGARDTLNDSEFPFRVEQCKTRRWAVLAGAWSKGRLKGRTGVLLRPSRMAGDAYKLAVYAAWDRAADGKYALDRIDEPLNVAADLTSATGTLEVWRELHIARYWWKAGIADFVTPNLGAFNAMYNEAYVQLVNKMGGGDNVQIPNASYNQKAEDAMNASGNALLTDHVMVTAGLNHYASLAEFVIVSFANFVVAFRAWFAAQNPGHPNPLVGANTWLANHGYGNAAGYRSNARNLLLAAGMKLVNDLHALKGAVDGITIVHFQFVHSLDAAALAPGGNHPGVTNGGAIDVPGATRHKCCFAFWNPRIDTFVHEIGHHLFLPHSPFKQGGRTAPGTAIVLPAPGVPGNVPAGSEEERHDWVDTNCVMSYNRPRQAFCGLCQLRLRGWDAGPNDAVSSKLKKNSAQNRKP